MNYSALFEYVRKQYIQERYSGSSFGPIAIVQVSHVTLLLQANVVNNWEVSALNLPNPRQQFQRNCGSSSFFSRHVLGSFSLYLHFLQYISADFPWTNSSNASHLGQKLMITFVGYRFRFLEFEEQRVWLILLLFGLGALVFFRGVTSRCLVRVWHFFLLVMVDWLHAITFICLFQEVSKKNTTRNRDWFDENVRPQIFATDRLKRYSFQINTQRKHITALYTRVLN